MCGCVPLNAIGQLEHKYVENSCKKRGFNSYVPFSLAILEYIRVSHGPGSFSPRLNDSS